MFDGEDLKRFVSQATWVAVNDYEAKMLADRTGTCWPTCPKDTSQRPDRDPGADGCNVTSGRKDPRSWRKAAAVVDPTGCGDAFRGGLLLDGLVAGWDLWSSRWPWPAASAPSRSPWRPPELPLDRAALGPVRPRMRQHVRAAVRASAFKGRRPPGGPFPARQLLPCALLAVNHDLSRAFGWKLGAWSH